VERTCVHRCGRAGWCQRSGAAIGFQQSVLSGYGVAAPVLFAASIAAFSWPVAFVVASLFPLAGWLALRPLRAY
jgi:hypothetical protein